MRLTKSILNRRGIKVFMIEVKKLDSSNLELYLEYLKKAFEEEPDMMVGGFFDPDGIRNRINDPFYQRTTSLLAIENNKVLGRLEYHFYGCMQDGHRMCYVRFYVFGGGLS